MESKEPNSTILFVVPVPKYPVFHNLTVVIDKKVIVTPCIQINGSGRITPRGDSYHAGIWVPWCLFNGSKTVFSDPGLKYSVIQSQFHQWFKSIEEKTTNFFHIFGSFATNPVIGKETERGEFATLFKAVILQIGKTGDVNTRLEIAFFRDGKPEFIKRTSTVVSNNLPGAEPVLGINFISRPRIQKEEKTKILKKVNNNKKKEEPKKRKIEEGEEEYVRCSQVDERNKKKPRYPGIQKQEEEEGLIKPMSFINPTDTVLEGQLAADSLVICQHLFSLVSPMHLTPEIRLYYSELLKKSKVIGSRFDACLGDAREKYEKICKVKI